MYTRNQVRVRLYRRASQLVDYAVGLSCSVRCLCVKDDKNVTKVEETYLTDGSIIPGTGQYISF